MGVVPSSGPVFNGTLRGTAPRTSTGEDMPEATADVSEFIESKPAQIWEALTNPEKIREYYLGADVTSDWKVGSPITWRGEWEGKAYSDKGEILDFQPSRHLSYSHWSPMTGTEDAAENYHRVDIDLTEVDGGTQVRLRQSNLEGGITAGDLKSRSEFEENWRSMLQGLRNVVEGSDSR
jgi:uncharacterized protein YndB with AHSA1/START domain